MTTQQYLLFVDQNPSFVVNLAGSFFLLYNLAPDQEMNKKSQIRHYY